MLAKLNMIGAGTVARVLGRLWHETGALEIGAVMNRSIESACDAVSFIGAGQATADIDALPEADLWLIGVKDDQIGTVAESIQNRVRGFDQVVVFHLSGSRNSHELNVLRDEGIHVASLHPLKSFPEPMVGYQTFDRTFCGLEGDDPACDRLDELLQWVGARVFRITAEQKINYHAANTMICNHLVSLIDMGLEGYASAGIEQAQALEMITPLVTETLGNTLVLGAEKALTGPVVRGDVDTVAAHLAAIPQSHLPAYRALAQRALELAQRAERIGTDQAEKIHRLLR